MHGEGIGFRIERGDGQSIELACAMDDLSDIFHLATLAKDAGAVRDTPLSAPSKTYYPPTRNVGTDFQGIDQDIHAV